MTVAVISLGAGVQSSVMALLAARGLIEPMPIAAIFADTQWEPKAVYDHLDWLEGQLPFPVRRCTAGNIRDDAVNARTAGSGEYNGRWVSMPWHTKNPDGSRGMIRRQCTKEYKLEPLARETRKALGFGRHDRIAPGYAEQWIGISTDEMVRCKDSGRKYVVNRWPLIELHWDRAKCLKWFEDKYPGRKLPRSACIGCPYRKRSEWRSLTDEELADAIDFDHAIRHASGMRGETYTHRSLKPLDEALDDGTDDQAEFGFLEECDGMCGT